MKGDTKMDKKNLKAIYEEAELAYNCWSEARELYSIECEKLGKILVRIQEQTLPELTKQLSRIIGKDDLKHIDCNAVFAASCCYGLGHYGINSIVGVAEGVRVVALSGVWAFEPDVSEILKDIREKRTATENYNKITEHVKIVTDLLSRLERKLTPMIGGIGSIIANSGVDFNKYPEHQKKAIDMALTTAQTLLTVINTPILTPEGQVSVEVSKLPEIVYPVLAL